MPITIIARPENDFFVSFSFKIKYENAIETTMLNLSIGTTILAGPICKAL